MNGFASFILRHRLACLLASVAAYAAVLLLLGDRLAVSANYFVIAPVVVIAVGYGLYGGLLSGIVALPANLVFFQILGHPEFSPASKLIAEVSGVAVGVIMGRLADYFREVEEEIRKRVATEEQLRKALAEKELLLRELNHRVKNNLNVIKSIVQLQRSRSSDPDFLEATDELSDRIFAISLVHDQLVAEEGGTEIDPVEYVSALVENIRNGILGLASGSIDLEFATGGRLLPTDAALSLGLVVNEVLTNALKYASPSRDGRPTIRLALSHAGGFFRLVIEDDGPGPAADGEQGLGLKLVRALARNLDGTASLGPVAAKGDGSGEAVSGARFELSFPV